MSWQARHRPGPVRGEWGGPAARGPRASSDIAIHRAVYVARPDVLAVAHAHLPASMALTLVTMVIATILHAVTNHQVDAMASIPPSSTLIGPENFDMLVDLETTRGKVFDPDYLFTVFSANSDFVKNRPEVALNFCKAVVETVSYMKDPANERQFIDFTAKTLKLQPQQAEELVRVYKSGFNAKLTKERWEGMKKYAAFVPDWATHAYEPCASVTAGGCPPGWRWNFPCPRRSRCYDERCGP